MSIVWTSFGKCVSECNGMRVTDWVLHAWDDGASSVQSVETTYRQLALLNESTAMIENTIQSTFLC